MSCDADDHPRERLEAAPPGSTLAFDSAVEWTVTEPLVVNEPDIEVRGLTLRVADGADANALEVTADGVGLYDFRVNCNKDAQTDDKENSGVVVNADDVRVERGVVRDVDRHGILVGGPPTRPSLAREEYPEELADSAARRVRVRDVDVIKPRRDGCSVQGPHTASVLVDGVHTVGSRDRGCVEVKDGASDVLVTNCTAADSNYGYAVQDHSFFGTRDVVIANNLAVGCNALVDTQTHLPDETLTRETDVSPPRHEHVLITGNSGRDLHGTNVSGGSGAIFADRIDGLLVGDNVVRDVDVGVELNDCPDAQVCSNAVASATDAGVSLVDSSGALVTGNAVLDSAGDGIQCTATTGSVIEVQVCTNRCARTAGAGITLREAGGRIDACLVAQNVVRSVGQGIDDGASGDDGLVTANIT